MSTESRRRFARRTAAVTAAAVAGAGVLPLSVAPAQAASFRKADSGAKIVSYKWLNKGKTSFDFTVQSPSLGGAKENVRVLLPKGWKFGSKKTWPVVYALHGGNDRYISWTRSTDIEQVARRWGVIVVMPEGRNGSYTNWFNGGKGGTPKWEDFHVQEVRQLMERNYGAGGSRAVMGLSSGGQGACTYAGRHPGMFRHASCFSGVLSMSHPGIPTLLMYTNMRSGQDPYNIWGVPWIHKANWDAHDPIKLLPRMRGTKLYVSSGTTGEAGPFDKPGKAPWDIGYLSERAIGPTVKAFVEEAKRQKVSVTSHIYGPGSHSWPYWQREMHTAWPQIMKTLGAKRV
ncbi:alpha/beta hydrolase [Actinomadura kijaniata]|uniref:alpha/beta hydrolase n=1 Tax=Actinomadura kijaniata TaxID=46161 RepID=UPI00082A3E7E|nr:alpha/beta hydrolase family protein [Actinomadura kijaniata]